MSRAFQSDGLEMHHVPSSPTSRTRLPPDRSSMNNNNQSTMAFKGRLGSDDGFGKRPTIARRVSRNNMPASSSLFKLKQRFDFRDTNLPTETVKRIDYVIIHDNKTMAEVSGEKEKKELEKKLCQRKMFFKALDKEGFEVDQDKQEERTIIKLHTPFARLCREAERIKLEMPLEGCEIYEDREKCCSCWINCKEKLETDNEVDFVSAPFEADKIFIFEGHTNADTFFRPSLRYFLTNHILINMDIRNKAEEDEDPMAKKGLPYLLHKKVFSDAFVLHDETREDPVERAEKAELHAIHGNDVDIEDPDGVEDDGELLNDDTRRELMDTWGRICPTRFQPLWKIRNYFGEKIALYFAWSGVLIETLWLPTIFGLAVFLYGLYLSATEAFETTDQQPVNETDSDLIKQVASLVTESLGVIKKSFDNDVTPFFALVICLWGTIFLEVWKRRNATLAYEWDVDSFEDNEVDRPQFVGTAVKPDPVTKEDAWYYPSSRQALKFLTSFSFLIMMVCMVFIAAASIIVYRVFMTVNYCGSLSSVYCLCVTTVVSSILNAVAILILGKLYEKLAIKFNDWENHRTQTQYDDALIIKIFAFQFANSYTSCFYIAFFRGFEPTDGIFGLGPGYQDSCGENQTCMAMLSFQVLILMLMKPLPKFLKDIIIPWLRSLWRKRTCCRGKGNRVDSDGKPLRTHDYLERERLKPELGEFTLWEYTEKVLVYGFLMLFAASFPLAPLIALLINLCDIRVDARRMLWMYRRPTARIAQDIGMWYGILTFLNFVGVISNAFLIAFTSSWGAKYDTVGKVWIVIIFENILLFIKFLLHVIIPDVPSDVKLFARRHVVFAIKFMMIVIIPDVPSNVILSARRHLVIFVKYVVAVMIPDEPAAVGLAKRREKFQVARILASANQKNIERTLTESGKGRLSQRGSLPDRFSVDGESPPYDSSRQEDERRLLQRRKKKKRKETASEQWDSADLSEDGKPKSRSPKNARSKADTNFTSRTPRPVMHPGKLPVIFNTNPNPWQKLPLTYGANGESYLDQSDHEAGLGSQLPPILETSRSGRNSVPRIHYVPVSDPEEDDDGDSYA